MVNKITTVAVIGAGGATGFEVVKLLNQRASTKVVAIVRDPAKYTEKFANLSNVRVVAGDVSSPEKIPLSDVQKVVFTASASTYWRGPAEVDYQGVVNAIAASKENNVENFVLVTSRLVNPVNRWHPIRIILNNIRWGLMDNKFKGEEALRNSGLPSYTIVRPGTLIGGEGSSVYQKAGPDRLPNTDFIVFGGAEANLGRSHDILRTDVAAVIVCALFSKESKDKIIEVVARKAEEGEKAGVHDSIFSQI